MRSGGSDKLGSIRLWKCNSADTLGNNYILRLFFSGRSVDRGKNFVSPFGVT